MNDLLEEVKRRLKVTWEYDDEEISSIIEDGKIFIIDRVGSIEFTDKKRDARQIKLLKEYCRYAWEGSASFFENDFKREILNLQIVIATKKRGTKSAKE